MATIDGTQGRDSIFGTPDPDEIRGLGDRDYIVGLDGNDNLAGNDGQDVIFGNQGDDIIAGGQDDDFIRGGSGNDDILGEDGDDIVLGDDGNDNITGGDGNDLLAGNQGTDEISGGDGDDTVWAGQDNDTLLGGDGNDFLYGDLGADVLFGGAGNDLFVIGPNTGGPTMADADVVEDFTNSDSIGLTDGLTIGQIRWTFVPDSDGSITGSTVIQHLATQEFLAIIKGTRAGTITSSSFTTNLGRPPQPRIPIGPTDPPDDTVPGNNAPVAEDLTLNLDEDAVFDDRGSATDADGDDLTFSLGSVPDPVDGKFTVSQFSDDGRFTIRAKPNATGTDTFTYTANDGTTNSAPATVTVNLSPVNDPPNAISLSTTQVPENSAIDAVIADVSASDPDDDNLTLSLVNSAGGRFKLEGGQLKIANASLFDSEDVSDPVNIRILARDGSGATFAKDFVLTVGGEIEELLELDETERLAYTVNTEVSIDMSAEFIGGDIAFNNSVLNVNIVEGGTGGDTVSIISQGMGTGQIGFDLNAGDPNTGEVSYEGTVIGTVQRLSQRRELEITFNGSATEEAIDALLKQISFKATAVDSGLRDVRFTFTDSTGEISDFEVRGITVNPVTTNSPPTANDATFTIDENSINGTNVGTVSATDPDGDALSYSITAGNTSPDGDGDPAFAINATTGQITVNDSGDLDFETTPTFTLTVEVQETGGAMQSDTATITIDLNNLPESTPPDIDLPGGAVTYSIGGAAAIIDSGATVTDSDSADFDTGVLTVSLTAGATANDRLAVNNQGTGAGQIGVSGSNITFGGTTIGTFSGGTGTTPLSITLNASADTTATQALLRNITYENVSGTPSTTARTVQFQLTDGDGGTSSAETETINLLMGNPVLSGSSSSSYTEGAGMLTLMGAATVTDSNSTNLTRATIQFTSGYQTGIDSLDFMGALPLGISLTPFNPATGIIELTGTAPRASYESALRTLFYQNPSQDPGMAARTVTITIEDDTTPTGLTNGGFNHNISVTPVNDLPEVDLDGAGGDLNFENTFSSGGSAVNITDTDATISDLDHTTLASVTAQITNIQDMNQEILAATPSGAISAVEITYDAGTGTLTIADPSAPLADYQAVLRSITYENTAPSPTGMPDRTIDVIANDGIADSNTATSTVTVSSLTANDDPVVITDNVTTSHLLLASALLANDDSGFITNSPAPTLGFTNGTYNQSGGMIASFGFNGSQAAFNPPGVTFTYTLDDGGGNTDPATVTVTKVTATTGDDNISGGAGPDVLDSDNGNDTIDGNEENDNLIGGNGNDILIGGLGNDTLTSEQGDNNSTNRDSFRYEALNEGLDVITDFNVGRDNIDFNDGAGTTFDAANFAGADGINTKVEVTAAGGGGTDITNVDVVFWNAGTVANASAIDTLLEAQNGTGSHDVIVVYSTGSQTRVAYDTDGSTAGSMATDIAILSDTFLDGSVGNNVTIANLSANTIFSPAVLKTFRVDGV